MSYVVAILTGGGIASIVELVKFFANKKEQKRKEHNILESIHRDGKRTQLMLLISDYPDRVDEIMEVAETYFVKLKGNWYAHEIFSQWLDEKGIQRPSWYR